MSTVFETILPIESPPKLKGAKDLYFSLLKNPQALEHKQASVDFINAGIMQIQAEDSLLPDDLQGLEQWLVEHNQAIGHAYQEYLESRKAGEPRRYFKSRAHALYFIRSVAPTKMVDGSWLYGVVKHWEDQRLSSLIKIYLEELGDGVEAMNHVVLYRQLLKTHECEDWKELDASFFTQGAIQLSLSNNAREYLPEVIGFNLGYEQLPLHLLITAYELNELNIDPYYFSLHVTIDNAQSGHAQRAIQAVKDTWPLMGDEQAYIKRVINGAKLNNIGLGTLDIIDSFDLEKEVVRILQKKAALGQYMHSDRCVIKGHTINHWLSDPALIPELLHFMQENGWIKRHEDPENSRFWRVIEGEGAPMFGVFTRYERQVIYDWIAGDTLESLPRQKRLGKPWKLHQSALPVARSQPRDSQHYGNIYEFNPKKPIPERNSSAINPDFAIFETQVNGIDEISKRASLFIEWMSPAKHHSPIGLMATRYFKLLFNTPAP